MRPVPLRASPGVELVRCQRPCGLPSEQPRPGDEPPDDGFRGRTPGVSDPWRAADGTS